MQPIHQSHYTYQGHPGHSQGRCQRSVRQPSCHCLLSELSAEITSVRGNAGGNEPAHLPAVGIYVHDILRQRNDQLARIICFATTTEARCVPGSL